MRLVSSDGECLELRAVRYEFGPEERDEWDRNWLVVRGDARTASGVSWSFTQPCLTTWEARRLALWLEAAARGEVTPSPTPPAEDDDGLQSFTEPNIALSVASAAPGLVGVRFHLSQESAPPSSRQPVPFHLTLLVAPEDLRRAAEDWRRDLEPLPER